MNTLLFPDEEAFDAPPAKKFPVPAPAFILMVSQVRLALPAAILDASLYTIWFAEPATGPAAP